MNKYGKEIDLEYYYEPRKNVVCRMSMPADEPEMTEYESAFICGLIKQNRPLKILEVGVAAGGTSAVLLECMESLKLYDSKLISVDISSQYYVNPKRKTGYLAEEYKKKMDNQIEHITYFGRGALPQIMEEIGAGIDFVILDTVHMLPGELLDFPVLLPYVNAGCIITLHDTSLHFYNHEKCIATRLVLSCASGRKIIPLEDDIKRELANVGAIVVDDTTINDVENCFCAMLCKWGYIPEESILMEYGAFYKNYYDNELCEMFELACSLNKKYFHLTMKLRKRITRSLSILFRGY